MKLSLIAVLAILASVNADEHAEPDYMPFPDGDGVIHWINLSEQVPDVFFDPDSITFNLFTRENPSEGQALTLNEIESVTRSNFHASRPTRFITHGWRSSGSSESCILIRNAYIATGDYNMIIVDWSGVASSLYIVAARNVKIVGERVSEFINFMNKDAGLDLDETIIIGHSLGSHVAGISAYGARKTLQAVVALDPASPKFGDTVPGTGLDSNDAANVQVIHTNGGKLGISQPRGNSDFYPNGGRKQPGCGLDLTGSCSHFRSYYLFAESIKNATGFRTFENSKVFMGGPILTNDRGVFTLKTAASSPFAMG